MIRVLVVDDQAMVRRGLVLLLGAEPDVEVVGEAREGGQALRLVQAHAPDVVLMDIRMPGMDGLEATRRLAAEEGGPAIVVLTTFDADTYVDEALRAGAVGFVLKDSDPERLVEAVRAAAAGDALLDPAVTRAVISRYMQGGPTPTPAASQGLDQLTPRERDVFDHLVRGASNATIARALHVEPSTVKTHVTAVLRKLGLRDRVDAVIHAYEAGLVRRPPPPPDGGDEVTTSD